jgi:hypothetical protein
VPLNQIKPLKCSISYNNISKIKKMEIKNMEMMKKIILANNKWKVKYIAKHPYIKVLPRITSLTNIVQSHPPPSNKPTEYSVNN